MRLLLFNLILIALPIGNRPAHAVNPTPLYEDPFDIGAGGASLTRASQAGMIFSNPALMPYGAGFHRWAGNQSTLLVGKDSISFVQSLKNNSSSGASSQSQVVTYVDKVLKTPLHAGAQNNLAYINKSFGLSVFNRGEVDISAKKYGDTGLPAVRFRAESYQGVGLSLATLSWTRAISFGTTVKYIYAGAPDLTIQMTDQTAIQNLQSGGGLKSLVAMNTGTGVDTGMLVFLQGVNTDYRLALKADDIGGTKLSGKADLKEIPQTYSAGLGFTIHNGVDAIHTSVDYRDILNADKQYMFRRIRAGTKLLVRNHFGVGLGYYDGWPSYSVELDIWVMRFTGVYYTREMGDKPGIDPRPIYAAGLSIGI